MVLIHLVTQCRRYRKKENISLFETCFARVDPFQLHNTASLKKYQNWWTSQLVYHFQETRITDHLRAIQDNVASFHLIQVLQPQSRHPGQRKQHFFAHRNASNWGRSRTNPIKLTKQTSRRCNAGAQMCSPQHAHNIKSTYWFRIMWSPEGRTLRWTQRGAAIAETAEDREPTAAPSVTRIPIRHTR